MVNPIAVAGCLAIGFGGLAFALVGGDSRADKRRAAVAKSDAKALNASANTDRAARKKQIADGLRDIERKGKRRFNLAARIGQAGLSITTQQYWIGSLLVGAIVSALAFVESRSALLALLIFVVGAVGLPQLTLSRLRIRRINKFIANFPTAIARHQVRLAARRYDPHSSGRKPRAGEGGISPGRGSTLARHDLAGSRRADGAASSSSGISRL